MIGEAKLRQAPGDRADGGGRGRLGPDHPATTPAPNLEFRKACTPGYYNGEGRAGDGGGLFDGLYGPGSVKFFDLIRSWREEGMNGLRID